MCGRYRLSLEQQELLATYVATLFMDDWEPRYNIAPTDDVPVLTESRGARRIERFRWGFVPSWADDPRVGNRMINARSETVSDKPSFRVAWKRRQRCVIPANGFYEWSKADTGNAPKVPHAIQMADQRPFGFAGLWGVWTRDDVTLRTCTILTTEANDLIRPVSDRMPVVLGEASVWDAWIDPGTQESTLKQLLRPFPSDEMHAYPVTTYVNKPGNEGDACIRPV